MMNNPLENPGSELSTQNNPHRWRWLDVLLISIYSVVFILLGSWLLNQAYHSMLSFDSNLPLGYIVGLTALEGAALLSGIYLLGVRRKHIYWRDVGFRPLESRWIRWAIVIALIFIPIVGLIALAIQMALGLPPENPQLDFLLPQRFNWLGAISMVLLGGVIVPIAEEAFFRGVLYAWMRQHAPAWVAILFSSLIFGALHGDISVAGATFVMGVILAWFYERSHSLWAPITIHILNNSFKLLLLYILLAAGIQIPPMA